MLFFIATVHLHIYVFYEYKLTRLINRQFKGTFFACLRLLHRQYCLTYAAPPCGSRPSLHWQVSAVLPGGVTERDGCTVPTAREGRVPQCRGTAVLSRTCRWHVTQTATAYGPASQSLATKGGRAVISHPAGHLPAFRDCDSLIPV